MVVEADESSYMNFIQKYALTQVEELNVSLRSSSNTSSNNDSEKCIITTQQRYIVAIITGGGYGIGCEATI